MKNCIIVGGGISGLFASILAADHADKVILIESEAQCGGLLRSWHNADGVCFDYGTHILSETSCEVVNNIMFKGIYANPQDWSYLDITKVSNSFEGKIYHTGQFVPLQHLPTQAYNNALAEILAAPGLSLDKAENLEQYALANYGHTVTENVLRPLMAKLQDAQLSELHPSAHTFFCFNRFIAGDEQLSRELKKSPTFDAKLAFATYYDGLSGAKKFYPKHRGIELWIEYLVAQAKDKGVEIKTATKVEQLQQDNSKITGVTLADGQQLPCDHLVWTIPPIFALRQLGIAHQGPVPEFCPMSLHHMVFDQPFNDKNYYSNINDLDSKGFRLTLYPNITLTDVEGPHRCTVEVLCSGVDDMDELNDILEQELKTLGYVAMDAKRLSADALQVPMGFPKMTCEFMAEKGRQIDKVNAHISNISLIGRASRDQFFHFGILQEAHQVLAQLFQAGESA